MSKQETEATSVKKRSWRTYLVTTLIFTPKTPDCFPDGILFRLNSLLVNLNESFTEI